MESTCVELSYRLILEESHPPKRHLSTYKANILFVYMCFTLEILTSRKYKYMFKKSAAFQMTDIFIGLYLKYFGIQKITDNNTKNTL